jgi:hypothetical protein
VGARANRSLVLGQVLGPQVAEVAVLVAEQKLRRVVAGLAQRRQRAGGGDELPEREPPRQRRDGGGQERRALLDQGGVRRRRPRAVRLDRPLVGGEEFPVVDGLGLFSFRMLLAGASVSAG